MADIEQVDATQGAGEPLYKGFAKVNEIITKINAIEAGATQDQTEAEIKALLAAEIAKLTGIEANAKGDQTATEIVTLLETLAGDAQLSLAKLKDTAAYKKLTAVRQIAIDDFLSNYFVDGIRKLGGDLDANNHSINNVLALEAENVKARRLENLCRNAAFASRSGGTAAVPDEWVLELTPTVAYAAVDTGYGDYAVKLTATGAANEGINQTLTHLKPSTKYQIFVRAKATGGNSDTARLLTTGATTNIDTETTSTTWASLTGKFITDASGTDVVIKLLAKADGDIIWFCGITCVEGDIPPGNFIRRVNETIWLTSAIADTDWDGDAFSSNEADIDLSSFGNGCPAGIKAVLLFLQYRDSGTGLIILGPGGITLDAYVKYQLLVETSNLAANTMRSQSSWISCNSNGNIRYKINASGENTSDVWIYILGYVLGE